MDAVAAEVGLPARVVERVCHLADEGVRGAAERRAEGPPSMETGKGFSGAISFVPG